MGPIAWIVFGGLAGWVASIIAGTNRRQGCLMNIVVGIVGAFIGGAVYSFLTGESIDFTFRPVSFIVAVVGSLILLSIVNLIQRRR
jgi:uncharacterized membrane protein YeaQ/YmgE (transglycosylase-associated protein family)